MYKGYAQDRPSRTPELIFKACEDQGGIINEDHAMFYTNRNPEFKAELDERYPTLEE